MVKFMQKKQACLQHFATSHEKRINYWFEKNQTHDFWTEALARATHYCTALNIFATSVFNFIAKTF